MPLCLVRISFEFYFHLKIQSVYFVNYSLVIVAVTVYFSSNLKCHNDSSENKTENPENEIAECEKPPGSYLDRMQLENITSSIRWSSRKTRIISDYSRITVIMVEKFE